MIKVVSSRIKKFLLLDRRKKKTQSTCNIVSHVKDIKHQDRIIVKFVRGKYRIFEEAFYGFIFVDTFVLQ